MNSAVWVIDDDPSIRWVLEKALQKAEIPVRSFADADLALRAMGRERPGAVVSDLRMPGLDGLSFLREIQQRHPQLPVIIITAHSDLENAVAAFQGGAFEYLAKPFDIDDAVSLVQRALTVEGQQAAQEESGFDRRDTEIIGESPAMQEVYRAIGRLSRSSINVLILGESGSGKELVARALHRHSPRVDGPFVAINTAAIPAELLESELFGHEKGAFTGAVQARKGRFEQAAGGTLFLDEIGDMPAALQTRLLRVLSDGTYYRVGGHAPIRADVRILAATHQDLQAKVRDGSFREDLYHRLNVISIHIPPLRERRSDIPRLARFFLHRAAESLGVEGKTLSPEAEARMAAWSWPGNVRQLENSCRWITVMAPSQRVELSDLPPELLPAESVRGQGDSRESDSATPDAGEMPVSGDWRSLLHQEAAARLQDGDNAVLDALLPDFERVLLQAALDASHGHKQLAAERLGWGRNTIARKMRSLGME
ncbi:nitrogen regulation protein NR(I) [Acidithiobacillus sp. YTS05]|nr:nitrogen regulation protein NR(I) [Acidithiobacillus sp. YTS05]